MAVIVWEAVVFTLFPLIGSFMGSSVTRPAIKSWYDTDKLKKPKWKPPNWAFPPVWTFLYLSMGYASYLVWRDGGGFDGAAKVPLILYAVQLLLNWAWSFIFFWAKKVELAFYEIVLMDLAIVSCLITFLPINPIAGYLLAPYLAWVSFACALNYSIWRMNDSSGGRNKASKKRNKSS